MTQATPTSPPPLTHAFPHDPVTLYLPDLPQELEGFRILQLSDMHVHGPRARQEEVLAAAAMLEYDLLVITGDSMTGEGDEPAAHELLIRVMRVAKPRVGVAGVFGNHDSPAFRSRVTSLPIRWLCNAAWTVNDLPLSILGVDCAKGEHSAPAGDLLAAVMDEQSQRSDLGPRCHILLSHMPIWLPPAADLKIDLMLSGHTHGGQCRLPTGHILYNATPGWPLNFSTGLLRLGQTQCLITRGLGEVYMQGLRVFCKPQLPLITLCRDPNPPPPVETITLVRKW